MFSHRNNKGSAKGGLVGFVAVLAAGWAFANLAEIVELVRYAA